MKRILFVLVFILMLVYPVVLSADSSITLIWDGNNHEADLAGYRVYQSSVAGVYDSTNFVAEVLKEFHTATLKDIPDGKYYWVITAYDTCGNESTHSNEVTYTIDTSPPVAPTGAKILINIAISVDLEE